MKKKDVIIIGLMTEMTRMESIDLLGLMNRGIRTTLPAGNNSVVSGLGLIRHRWYTVWLSVCP